ncbi:SGNH/GDSL hydrolase family protein [Arthrobacter zhaoxinii]|uniref:SGNH/GDSL hydrolase family protein n=1 Tax=Arthrobacter zhaoxinii TaxID=2964616 RepID=A0ABY5YVF2_9MICC|nr:SGNH/GDSL hydrolase family protein [Arthrobacter zhaoxinii]UWX97969.1 SGNH/GDSL hydrolase family protein [Arthrobacter zhaoxinii]
MGLVIAAGLLTFYAMSQSQEANGAPGPARTTQPAEKVPQIDILGDSYVGGSAEGGNGAANWTKVVGTRFYDQGSRVELNVIAQPGSGYLARGTTDLVFREAATLRLRPTADVVLVFGSRNDGRQDDTTMYDAAQSLYSDIQNIAPEAKVVVVGPVWVDADVPDFISANNEAMARAASDGNVVYIDALAEGWFAGSEDGLIGADGIHPTDEGHAYLASKIFPLLEDIIEEPAP